MAHPTERAAILAEIVMLCEHQFQSEIDATRLGWTLRAKVAKQRRSNHISFLMDALDDLDTVDALNDPTRATN